MQMKRGGKERGGEGRQGKKKIKKKKKTRNADRLQDPRPIFSNVFSYGIFFHCIIIQAVPS